MYCASGRGRELNADSPLILCGIGETRRTRLKAPRGVAAATLLGGFLTFQAWATWSVVAVNRSTQEVGVASATCLSNIDLQSRNAAVKVGVGVGNVQAMGDREGTRRMLMLHELINGSSSERIVEIVRTFTEDPDLRQFGVAHVAGSSATSTTVAADFASGVADRSGEFFYAIQGNVLTGEPVVLEAEKAFIETEGALPERMMAAMLAARSMGGDGRCSCPGRGAMDCGSPPPSFTKAADVGYLIVSRLGDEDGDLCDAGGCARGDYYLNLNFPQLSRRDPDPVLLMADEFKRWRKGLRGRPDAVESEVELSTTDDGFDMKIKLADWRGRKVKRSKRTVVVEHAPMSAGATDIGEVVETGRGVYRVELTPNGRKGVDRFWIEVSDDAGSMVASPLPRLDAAACDAFVRKTKARPSEGKLTVRIQVTGADRKGLEVGVRIVSRLHEVLFETLGRTNKQGKARVSFALPSDLYDVHVDALVPQGGGECFDPEIPDQSLTVTDLAVD